MGIANTTAAAALCHAFLGGQARDWVGPGTGVDAAGLERKTAVVERAVERHREALGDPLEVLRRLGGREIAAIVGAILGARLARVPTVLDGYVVGAAAAVLHAMTPGALDHCLAGHLSAEPAHRLLLSKLGLTPILDLGMRLGEASGAVLAAGVVKAAVAAHNGMASFDEAGVAERDGGPADRR
jgi:nicotinate-nucleotide--dimethylbenzimidazole phosphoribosyltransferase